MSDYDMVFINPGDRKQVFQSLGIDVAGIEPPFWIAVMAAYLRNKGYRIGIIDAAAENIAPEETAARIQDMAPRYTSVVVYGSQPSASTQNMSSASAICRAVKETGINTVLSLSGLHPSALPERTLREESVDLVVDGEAVLTYEALLAGEDLESIKGLWRYDESGAVRHSERYPNITDLDHFLPQAAYDLLPMHLYRAHNWHCFDDIAHRQPYAAIYTSLGCPFNCVFCCINAPFGKPGIRYRSPELVLREIDYLVDNYQVRNLKIIDELFILNPKHYMTIVNGLIERNHHLNIWAYARVDTVKPEELDLLKKAGINWLALGIESANSKVRDGASKNMRVNDIKSIVQAIQNAGIRVIGNYIFGLPEDTRESMQETLDMAKDLNCEFANFYAAMAYPGSKLYEQAVADGLTLPSCWHGYSQHSFETLPLSNKQLTAAEILKFRDDAFHEYFSNPEYLDMLEQKFDARVRSHIVDITSQRLKRNLYS